MHVTSRAVFRWLFIAASVCVVFGVGAVSLLAYAVYVKQNDGTIARRFADVLRLPAARVGGTYVKYTDYLTQLDAERHYLSGPAAQALGIRNAVTAELKTGALDRVIRMAAVERFARERDVVVTPLDVDRAYDYVRQGAGTSTTAAEFQANIREAIGWEEKEFKRYVIRPALLEDVLKKKAHDASGDPEAFEKEFAGYLKGKEVLRYLRF